MLIATLPTLTGIKAKNLSEKILGHPLIGAVRYNTGGDSPYSPKEIFETLKPIADKFKKVIYIDLEGRQVRVAKWSPHSKGVVTLNRDFEIELPGMIHFRGAGWFDIVGALNKERKIFIAPRITNQEHYFGESQSVNIVAKKFEVIGGYLGDLDREYIDAAVGLGMYSFMLSFVESFDDTIEFWRDCCRARCIPGCCFNPSFQIVLKIESLKGIEFIKKTSKAMLKDFRLMAARDDLFLSFVNRRADFLDAVCLIIKKDRRAILASKIMSGLEYQGEVALGDMADIALMAKFGYKNFMLSDGLSKFFEEAMQDWQEIIAPILMKESFLGRKKWIRKS